MADNAQVQMFLADDRECDASTMRIAGHAASGIYQLHRSMCATPNPKSGLFNEGDGKAAPDIISLLKSAGEIGHDMNNLLTVIIGQCEMALRKLPASSPVRDELNEVMIAGERATSLTEHLLLLGRSARGPINDDASSHSPL
jgi:hypothetical protein